MQEFNDNEEFRRLQLLDGDGVLNIVRDTFIRDVEFQVIPSGKSYGVICAFELEHILIN